MQEDITIITGSPKKVQAKAREYLASHPKARVLGTAVTIRRGKPIEADAPPAEGTEPEAKNAKASKEPAAATLRTVEYGPDETVVCLTLGLDL